MSKIFRKAALLSFFVSVIACSCQNKKQDDGEGILKKDLPDWALGPFVRPEGVNPVISPLENTSFADPLLGEQVAWESNDTFNPAATVMGDSVYVIYRAEDKSGVGIGNRTSRLGLASSTNGYDMNRRTSPVLFPTNDNQKEYEWPGGCEDPRVAVTEDGTYVMLYTQWNKKVPRLAVATSPNLTKWTKHGPAFAMAYDGKYKDRFSKSASIVTTVDNGQKVIAKVNGRYWIYWGEKNIFGATSNDLINWYPVEDESGNLKPLFSPRPGFFDSQLTEAGPPAVLTDQGIVLLYNGKNLEKGGDPDYTPNTYCAGQALFDKNDPTKLLDRLKKPFFVPTESFEKSGQYPAGTVFIEGLVFFKEKWLLYYGCADSRVAVAEYRPVKNINKQ
jgi:predicted GH43/DUF377 family glycosyl hydrolase